MPSLTIENYVKAIYVLTHQAGVATAATGAIAQRLGISPGSVTGMLKTLSESGLVVYTPYEGVRLTDAGNALALRVLRRHRLIEQFLVATLDLTWDEVHEEAEHMEHAVSDLLVDRIDRYLGYPQTDPHGDPIPQSDGTLPSSSGVSLWAVPVGERFLVLRALDQGPEFLRYLADNQLVPGSRGRVLDCSAAADAITVEVDGRRATLSHKAAQKIDVQRMAQ
jgi:DtxR family Mn-dependent transcriptional regulator